MANVGETGAGHEANVTGTDDRKIHDWENAAGESAAAQVG
jgi:hypothetical protein